MALGPRESSRLICSSSHHVTINDNGIESLSAKLVSEIKNNKSYIHFKSWKKHPLNPKVADEKAVRWIFLVDALNFSFWTPKNTVKYTVEYAGAKHTGYWSLCAAINRAIDAGIPITDAQYLKDFTEEQAKHVFRSDSTTDMPLITERVAVMNEIGSVLADKFAGTFTSCIQQAGKSAQKLLHILSDNFPCFRDEGEYAGQKVTFYKRAQILIADLWACFEGKNEGEFDDIETITMFADYRIPQALVYFNVLTYSPDLQQLLEKEHMFQTGDLMEMEIRAASIWSVELLCQRINTLVAEDESLKDVKINAIVLDHFLWDYRRQHDEETKHIPFHKIRCIYY